MPDARFSGILQKGSNKQKVRGLSSAIHTADREIFVLHRITAEDSLEIDGNVTCFMLRLVVVLIEADKTVRGHPQIRRPSVNQHWERLVSNFHIGYVRLPSQLDRRYRFTLLASSDVIVIEAQYAPQRVLLGQRVAAPPYGDMVSFVGDPQDGSVDSGGVSQLDRRGGGVVG